MNEQVNGMNDEMNKNNVNDLTRYNDMLRSDMYDHVPWRRDTLKMRLKNTPDLVSVRPGFYLRRKHKHKQYSQTQKRFGI